MIHLPVLRTKRLAVQLRELSILDAITLAAIPETAREAAVSHFLQAAVASSDGQCADLDDWTVQERTLAVAHYMASTLDDGPDFSLDEAGEVRYSHYLAGERDYPGASVPAGEIAGHRWQAGHLTGRLAGAIERLQGEIPELDGRTHWLIGRMAAQLSQDSDPPLDHTQDDLDARLLERMRRLMGLAESDFIRLQVAWLDAKAQLDHLFYLDADATGLLVLPLPGVADMPPARFPARACVTSLAHGLGRTAAADRP